MISSLSIFVDEITNKIDHNIRPVTGYNSFTHNAGIHAASVIKDPSTYESMCPEKFGQTRKIVINKFSGKEAVDYRLKKLGFNLSNESLIHVLNVIKNKPDIIIHAAAKVGGILANNNYKANFIYENLTIQSNIIHSSFLSGVKNLIFLGSSCIYPKKTKQPIKESYFMTGSLEETNDAYSIAKIAGAKMCMEYSKQYLCLIHI